MNKQELKLNTIKTRKNELEELKKQAKKIEDKIKKLEKEIETFENENKMNEEMFLKSIITIEHVLNEEELTQFLNKINYQSRYSLQYVLSRLYSSYMVNGYFLRKSKNIEGYLELLLKELNGWRTCKNLYKKEDLVNFYLSKRF